MKAEVMKHSVLLICSKFDEQVLLSLQWMNFSTTIEVYNNDGLVIVQKVTSGKLRGRSSPTPSSRNHTPNAHWTAVDWGAQAKAPLSKVQLFCEGTPRQRRSEIRACHYGPFDLHTLRSCIILVDACRSCSDTSYCLKI
ncbi:hypothetical protein EVAR_49124_1 [Eumeta japonica]|uniref:Uncharacterized protein n=1 Tax=Eumeta variegata TaxID=151549 RepID=A0A4C1YR75_EUMVA|nr:hypothetical protein EVAR_49124_1 [Eumeta japonica]